MPGAEGVGDPIAGAEPSPTNEARLFPRPRSGGAGLLFDMRRAGRSILVTLLCCAKENWPSFVFSV